MYFLLDGWIFGFKLRITLERLNKISMYAFYWRDKQGYALEINLKMGFENVGVKNAERQNAKSISKEIQIFSTPHLTLCIECKMHPIDLMIY